MQPDMLQIVNAQITCVLIVDEQLVIRFANPAAQQLLAQSIRKLYGLSLGELLPYHSLNIPVMQTSLAKGAGFTDNEVTLMVAGQIHIVALMAQSIGDGSILLELFPLDNQRRLNHEQQQQTQQAAVSELVRGLAHEIKNPLGGLRGAAQLLARALPDPALGEYTQMIIEQADRLRNLVDSLLGPQRPGSKVQQNIHHAVQRVYQLIELEKGPNISLLRDYDPSLPEFVHDSEQIEQVLLNIARNALQALPEEKGHITLRTRTVSQVTMQGVRHRLVARIDILDSGIGVPVHLQDTLFYPLVSGHKTGTGLGLSIARTLVEQHAGKIEFNSWPGHTEFSVYLPIYEVNHGTG